MSNAKRLAISPDSFIGVLDALGQKYDLQSGFVKVHGPEGRRMYVGRGRITTTVHLSGFESEFGTQPLPKSPSKVVTQEMAWPDGIDAVEQLRLFASLVGYMNSLDPKSKAKKASSGVSSTPVQPLIVDPALVLAEAS